MSHSLTSLKGLILGLVQGTTLGIIEGDARSVDYSTYSKKRYLRYCHYIIRVYGVEV